MDVSYQEILQIRNDISSLTGLLEALKNERKTDTNDTYFAVDRADNPFTKSAVEESKEQERKRRYLQKLTEIKIQLSRLGGQGDATVLSTKMALDLNHFHMEDVQEEDEKFMGRTNATFKGREVWIEWKDIPYFPPSVDKTIDEKQQKVENRIRLLTELLCDEKPEGFHSPICLGYVKADVDDEPRYGIVFEKTADGDVSTIQISTLHELLQDRPKPSLSARISLCASVAECVHSFHAVNWLHKGLRSENVLFFKPKGDQVDLCRPYVTGFELSRPIDIEGMTEPPGFCPSQDIYRHPLAQSMQGSGKYRKAYDIYSLGVILIEIANWKGIDVLLGFEDISDTRPRELRNVHNRLLQEPVHLERIRSKFGDTFRDAVKVCLTSYESDKETEKNGNQAFVAMQLQRKLEEDVLLKLRSIEAATSPGK
jgi:serine/threonine protein kinase